MSAPLSDAARAVADMAAAAAFEEARSRPRIAHEPPLGPTGRAGFFLRRLRLNSSLHPRGRRLPLHPADGGGPATTAALVSSRVQTVLERRTGLHSDVQVLIVGGVDIDATPAERFTLARYEPSGRRIRLAAEPTAALERLLAEAPGSDPPEIRRRLEAVREGIATLAHEHVHGLADRDRTLPGWRDTAAGHAFIEGFTALVAEGAMNAIVTECELRDRFPGLDLLPPARGEAAGIAATAVLIAGLAEMAGISARVAVNDMIGHGGELSALAALVTQALERHLPGGDDRLTEAVTRVLGEVTRGFGELDPLGGIDAGFSTGTAVVDCARRVAGLRSLDLAPHDRDVIFDHAVGRPAAAALRTAEVDHTVVHVGPGCVVLISDRDRGDRDDATIERMVVAALARGRAPAPGATLAWSDLAGPEGPHLS